MNSSDSPKFSNTDKPEPRALTFHGSRVVLLGAAWCVLTGCAKPDITMDTSQRVSVSPTQQEITGEVLLLDASQIKPMYTELLPINLQTVIRVAMAENFDIRRARQAVEASRGRYESAVGAAFPAIVPTALFNWVDGTVRATEGNLVGVGFGTFQPAVALQWVVNPGGVVYEIVAARKRLSATADEERAVVAETLRRSAVEFYALVLSQSRVSAAHQGVLEAEELLRISRIRQRTGTGVPADEMRAQARLAQRRQDLISALKQLYDASVALAVTLHLDAAVTLVPSMDELPPIQLVRHDLGIETLLELALAHRPDLESVRTLVEAAIADRKETWWSGFGPQFALTYQYGGIMGHANNIVGSEGIPGNLIVNPTSPTGSFNANPVVNGLIKEGLLRGSRGFGGRDDQTFGLREQQRGNAGVGWRLSVSTFGRLKTAKAQERQVMIAAQRRLDDVKAQVVRAAQAGNANGQLIALAQQQVTAAEEALRLSEVNLRAGTMTTLDVLQAQDAATQARLRYAEAVVRYNQSQVDLLAALGLIDEEALTQSLAD